MSDFPRPCTTCNGAGVVTWFSTGDELHQCERCKGSGLIMVPLTLDEGGYNDADAAE